MTFPQLRNRLTTHFSELIPVVKRCMSVVTGVMKPYTPASNEMSNILKGPRLGFITRQRAWKCKVGTLTASKRKNNNEFLFGSD